MSFSVMYSGENYVYGVTVSLYPHQASWPIRPNSSEASLTIWSCNEILGSLEERRSRNPKMEVRIPFETANFSLFSAVSD